MSILAVVAEIGAIRIRSALAWEMAVNTAGTEYPGGSVEKATEMQALTDACDSAYEAAIEALEGQYDGWASAAKIHLDEAKSLETEGGDAANATEAITVFADYLAEGA